MTMPKEYISRSVRFDDGRTMVVWSNGNVEWLLGGVPHRLDGPAFEGFDGYRSWWRDGKRHRPLEDDPAVERADGTREWWVNGVQVPEPERGES